MKMLENVEAYKVGDPLFEGFRIILTQMGGKYSPQYIQGLAGTPFRIATGCPSRPTCVMRMWTTDFIKYMGYGITEYPCTGPKGEDLMPEMIQAVKDSIDKGRPALVWHAMTNAEWDVVCGYDDKRKVFFGRGSYKGFEGQDCHAESWDRAAKAV